MATMIGLTGGIGSGKSVVAKIFATLGIPVFNADDEAKRIMQTSPEIKSKLIQQFGMDIYNESGLDKEKLASIVFDDPFQLQLLNAIVHPVTIQAAKDWAAKQTSPYVIKEAALIFESGAADGLLKVIGVTAPLSLRTHRVMQRDGITKEQVDARMRNQISDTIKMRLCDYVIENNNQQMVLPQVLDIDKAIRAAL
ncbi:MAG: dephospho-CoA kinase [Chitinophagaceae bacterium]|jgi:dephospho-CoA kinase|nr:dephospho-CoA kinase [Chitinophagaceae bacterium]MCF8289404.1 dephospho-CoA kinase [Chitinophagaceae bacterium]MCF8422281.1 dephospho-CoA kinase [Chitinophagaceae bacterium]